MHRIKEKDRILDKLQGWIGLLYLVMMSGILVICILFSDSDIKFLGKVNYLPPLLLLAFGVVFALGLFQLCRNTVLPEKHKVCLFFIVSFGLFLFQVYSVYNYYFYTGWDVPQLINMSYAVAHGEDVLGFSGYFSQYPNNLFLVSVFSFIRKAAHLVGLHEHEYFVILCVQCLLNTGAGMLLAGVLDELFHKEQIEMLGYVLYLAFVWASPWVSIPYSDSMGLIFPVLIIYIYINRKKTRYSIIPWFAIAALAIIGYRIKPQLTIIFIAILIIETISFLRTGAGKDIFQMLAGIAAGILCATILSQMAISALHITIDDEKSFHMQHFFMMGMNPAGGGGTLGMTCFFLAHL